MAASGRENLELREFSDGGTLPAREVWVDARKAEDRIIVWTWLIAEVSL